MEKLRGTVVDAAIASMACNGAVHSHSNGIGGGFFMTIYKRNENKAYFLNAREKAPHYATENMFVNITDGTHMPSRRGNISNGRQYRRMPSYDIYKTPF